jgi:hypothetical protein
MRAHSPMGADAVMGLKPTPNRFGVCDKVTLRRSGPSSLGRGRAANGWPLNDSETVADEPSVRRLGGPRGLLEAFRRLISRKRPDQRAMTIADDLSQVSGLSALMIQRSFSSP